MSEFKTIWSPESSQNFPTIDYGRTDGIHDKVESLGVTYEGGVLHFSKSNRLKEIDVSQCKDILIRSADQGLIIEFFNKGGDYEEYRVDEQGDVVPTNEEK